MPNYKVVDVDKLDADLSALANTIRINNRSTEPLKFPQGYMDGVNAIPEDYLAKVFNKEIDKLINHKIQAIFPSAFQADNTNLTEVDLPLMLTLPGECFKGCTNLNEVNLPSVTYFGDRIFNGCNSLTQAIFPSLETCAGYGNHFASCRNLKTLILPKYSGNILPYMFNICDKLETLVLGGETFCPMTASTALSSSGIGKGTGYAYIRRHLYDTYVTGTNWSAIASQIRIIEEYPEIWALLTETFYLESSDGTQTEYKVSGGTTWGEWLTANGYTDWITEYGYITNDGNFFLGGNGTIVKTTDVITAGTFVFDY